MKNLFLSLLMFSILYWVFLLAGLFFAPTIGGPGALRTGILIHWPIIGAAVVTVCTLLGKSTPPSTVEKSNDE